MVALAADQKPIGPRRTIERRPLGYSAGDASHSRCRPGTGRRFPGLLSRRKKLANGSVADLGWSDLRVSVNLVGRIVGGDSAVRKHRFSQIAPLANHTPSGVRVQLCGLAFDAQHRAIPARHVGNLRRSCAGGGTSHGILDSCRPRFHFHGDGVDLLSPGLAGRADGEQAAAAHDHRLDNPHFGRWRPTTKSGVELDGLPQSTPSKA